MVETPTSGKEKVALISEILFEKECAKFREKMLGNGRLADPREAEELRRATRIFGQINRR